tara:strand:+ start:1431 stop:2678 length:1248 start_codon:yes stop_codon:yes gene_type:complete
MNNNDDIDYYFNMFKNNTNTNYDDTSSLSDNSDLSDISNKTTISSITDDNENNIINNYTIIEDIVKKLIFQLVSCGIDYESIGFRVFHNKNINDYINDKKELIQYSIHKQLKTCKNINENIKCEDISFLENQLWTLFIDETYGSEKLLKNINEYTMNTLSNILDYNLCMPLRAININIPKYNKSNTQKLNGKDVKKLVNKINKSLFMDDFVDFKFKSIDKQLSHLSVFNRHLWKYQYKCLHDSETLTTEGDDNYYMYFWATKIGEPSHGFDVNPQCLYPLLCNARNKVIFLYNKEFDDFAARAYLRILQTEKEAILWLENIEYNNDVCVENNDTVEKWTTYFIEHAYKRAEMLGIKLVIPWINQLPKEKFSIILDPSDGILETSNFISDQENWVQTETETYDFFSHVFKIDKVVK